MTDLNKYLRVINLRAQLALELLDKHGTQSQIERYARGDLAVDELLTVARTVFFEPFAGIDLKRFAKAHELAALSRSVRHAVQCPEYGRDDAELAHRTFTIHGGTGEAPGPSLSKGQLANLDKLRVIAAGVAEHPWLGKKYELDPDAPRAGIYVTGHIHVVSCSICKQMREVASGKVAVAWAEHTLVREWVL